jgi:asparagine synthetase B (glutamine-hydrolysing)
MEIKKESHSKKLKGFSKMALFWSSDPLGVLALFWSSKSNIYFFSE